MSTFRTYLKIVSAHRVYILVYLVLLSLVGLFLGLAYGTTDGEAFEETSTRVAVIDRDDSELSRALTVRALDGNVRVDVEDEKRAIQDALARDTASYLLVIPEGWGEGLVDAAQAGEDAPSLETYVSYRSGEGRLLDIEVTGYADGLYGMAATLGGDASEIVAATDAAWEPETSVSMVEQEATPLPQRLVVAFNFASYPVLSAVVVCIAVLMSSVNGWAVRSRRLASPEPARSRNVALLMTCVVIALVTWAWIFGIDVVVLGTKAVGTSPVQIALVGLALLVYALVAASIGFLLGQVGISENAANAAANILGMVMSFLGGAWTGLSLLPDSLIAIAHFVPAYWTTLAVEGASGMVEVTGSNVAQILGDVGVCALFGVAIALVGLVVGRSRSRAQLA